MPKDDLTWLNVGYAIFGIIMYFVFSSAAQTIGVQFGLAEKYDDWYPTASMFVSLALTVGAVFFLRGKKERHEYLLSSVGELRKVQWPTIEATRKMTMIVVIVVAVFSLILTMFDVVWGKLIKMILT